MVGRPMSRNSGSARSITYSPFLCPTTCTRTHSWRSNRLSHSPVLHPVCRYAVNSAYLHDSHSSVCDSWPVHSPDHHPDSSEGADPGQGSVYLLEEIHQRAWERKKRWMSCVLITVFNQGFQSLGTSVTSTLRGWNCLPLNQHVWLNKGFY